MKKINLLLAILVFATIFSCKTTKSRTEELSGIKKLYHNTTAQFNGFFNADVILETSVASLESAHQDNFNKVLPVFKYTEVEPIQGVNNDLDIAIEKVSIVATLHRQSDWTDDCYLLLGKAQYLQQDYESAEETLEYTLKEFSPSALSQRAREAARKKGAKGKKVQAKKSPAQKQKEQERDEYEEEEKLTKKQQIKQRNKTNKALKKKRIKDRKVKEKERKRRKKGKKPKAKKVEPTTEEKKAEEKPKEDPVNKIVKEPSEKEKKKAREKEENKPEKIFDTDKLAFDEIQLWLARTYIEREDYSLAERYLGYVQSSEKKVIKEQIDAVTAHMYLKQKRYDSAIPFIEKAIENSPDRNDKARYSFIRAQLAERESNNTLAAEYFTKAIKFSNNYEMEFSSRLAMLKSSYSSGIKDLASTTRDLQRMLKDEKNSEYQDQVYFTLAELNLESGDKMAAIDNFRKSLNTSSTNKAQRTETYLKLAELYYEDEAYVNSKLFYDSTLQIIDKVDDRYSTVKAFAENLDEIAKNIQIIALQDSLINISTMTPEEKKELAMQLKNEKDAMAAKAKTASNNKSSAPSKFGPRDGRRASNLDGPGGRPKVNNSQASTQFPLYNEKVRKKGAKDFDKKWGDRPLEDNWRRASRQGVDNLNREEIQEVAVEERLNEDDVNKILIAVPKDENQLKASHKKIETAYFDLGRLFRDRIQRNDKSIESLEAELLVRYPDTEHKLDSWYYLYLAHQKEGNKPQAKKYFDLIVANFPNTTYARVLTDPNYLEAAKKEGDKLGQYYKTTYASFQEQKYDKVIKDVDAAKDQFGPGNIMMAKFALLKAMSIGNTKGKEDYISQLKDVIGKFPNSPEETRAREILRLLGDQSVAVQPKTSAVGTGEKGLYKSEPEGLHYVAVVITNKNEQKVSDAKNSVADFNKENFRNANLRMSNIYLKNDVTKPILIIRKFKNQEKAMAYYKAATGAGKDFLTKKMDYLIYPLTQANYREVLKSGNFDGYDEFFKENYDF